MWHILFSLRIAARQHRHDMPPNHPITNFRALLDPPVLAVSAVVLLGFVLPGFFAAPRPWLRNASCAVLTRHALKQVCIKQTHNKRPCGWQNKSPGVSTGALHLIRQKA